MPVGRIFLQQPRLLGVDVNVSIVLVVVIVREPVQLELVGVTHVPVRGGGLVVDELVGRGPRRGRDVEQDVRDWETVRFCRW
jgi:hypothetical protein